MKINKDDISCLIREDIERINHDAAWTNDQAKIFNYLLTDHYTDEGIMLNMGISRNRYYRIKRQVLNKLIRLI